MDREKFELEKEIIEWLIKHGNSFLKAMYILSYSVRSDKTLSESCIYLTSQPESQEE